jgi:hypothetical protein
MWSEQLQRESNCYDGLSEMVIFIVYDLNGYLAYSAGISFYILEKQISSAYRNKTITCAQN